MGGDVPADAASSTGECVGPGARVESGTTVCSRVATGAAVVPGARVAPCRRGAWVVVVISVWVGRVEVGEAVGEKLSDVSESVCG